MIKGAYIVQMPSFNHSVQGSGVIINGKTIVDAKCAFEEPKIEQNILLENLFSFTFLPQPLIV